MEFKRPKKQIRYPASSTPQHDVSSPLTTSGDTPRSRFATFMHAKPTIISLVAIGCVLIGVLIWNVADGNKNNAHTGPQAPTYSTILPKGKSISDLGGWKRVSPPEKDPIFAFTDTIDTVPISVSEQPLPASFKNNATDQVAELAQKFNATDKIEAGDTTFYIGTSSKGPQSVIFTKNNVLILIKSENKIENTSWTNYVQSLN